MTYPLIISAPHACTTVSEKIKKRLLLTDYQIWKFNDPFTAETSFHPNAFFHNIGNIHRVCCDLSFGIPSMRFRTHNFYGASIYKEGQEFTKEEIKINIPSQKNFLKVLKFLKKKLEA